MLSVSGEITLVFSTLFKLLRCSRVFEGLLRACQWYAAPNHLHLLLTHTWLISPVCDLEMGAGGGSILLNLGITGSSAGPQRTGRRVWIGAYLAAQQRGRDALMQGALVPCASTGREIPMCQAPDGGASMSTVAVLLGEPLGFFWLLFSFPPSSPLHGARAGSWLHHP